VPTIAEFGFPGFEATAWFALAAPTGTPADIIAKINTTANAFIRSAKGKEELSKLDSLPAGDPKKRKPSSPPKSANGRPSSRRQKFKCSSQTTHTRAASCRRGGCESISRRKAVEFASDKHHGAFN
jgi:hypothetical protein